MAMLNATSGGCYAAVAMSHADVVSKATFMNTVKNENNKLSHKEPLAGPNSCHKRRHDGSGIVVSAVDVNAL